MQSNRIQWNDGNGNGVTLMEYLIMTAKDDERDQDDARHERLTKETKVESSNRPTGKLHCDWNHGKDGVNTFCFFCGATKGKGACNF